MARLLVLVEPSNSRQVPGQVVEVQHDGHVWSKRERKTRLDILVPDLSVEDARAKYLSSGVPQDAHDPRDPNGPADPKLYLTRTQVLDVAALPSNSVATVLACNQALRDCSAEATTAAAALAVAQIEATFGKVSQETLDAPIMDTIKGMVKWASILDAQGRGAEAKKLIQARLSISAAAGEGRALVEKPVLDAQEVPEPVVLSAADLEAVTVAVKP